MLKVNGSAFYRAVTSLSDLEGTINTFEASTGKRAKDEEISEEQRAELSTLLGGLSNELAVLGARVTHLQVLAAIKWLKGETPPTWGGMNSCCGEIHAALRSELQLIQLFVLPDEKAKYYAPKEPLFGKEVESKFPSISFEIEEAGKCFGLSRPTAAIFHLMRTMEYAIRAVARSLGIPDPTKASDRNWGTILREMKKDMDARGGSVPVRPWASRETKEFFEAIYVSLDAVRVAWRNPTMHVENKYTDDEAEHILSAVKGLMKKLASRIDENGDPKA